MNKRGFSLIELLATIVVLAIVFMIAYPIYSNTIPSTKDSVFRDNVRNVIQTIRTLEVVENDATYGCIADLDTKGTKYTGYWQLENDQIVVYKISDGIRYSEKVEENKMKENFDVVIETIEDACPSDWFVK